ncbi:hypothetical protein GCK72_003678 [Caenorhabditis remanei]|uniref:RING-type domain-containing protein n=1 Tax=Caenorhabditis remanei TaxID=31234 RepID=A0A6A5HBB5_CAERE|nr:hypothetical protein GCK72_003678 [Caenorhabditis remanei]KAF1763733.1 hypothetical protein GCK72_003678 [Caenorhabditis remanei]
MTSSFGGGTTFFFHQGVSSNKTFVLNSRSQSGLEMVHNLPSCFKLSPPAGIVYPPINIKVTFTPRPIVRNVENEPLFIKFTDKNTPISSTNPITYHLVVLDSKNKPPPPPRSSQSKEVKKQMPQKKIQEKVFDALDCKVCLQPFSEELREKVPRILTACGHTICDDCAGTILRLSLDQKIACPFDRKLTDGPVSALLKNFAILDIVRERAQSSSAIYCDEPANPCFENSRHEATCYCLSCKADFCESCFTSTHCSKIFSGHRQVSIDEKPFELPSCSIHPDNIAEFVCKQENCPAVGTSFCKVCQPIAHNKHAYKSQEEEMDRNHKVLTKLHKDLKRAEAFATSKLEEAMNCERSFELSNQCLLDAKNTVTTYFDDLKKGALKKMDSFYENKKKKFDKEMSSIENDLIAITETKHDVEKALKNKKFLYDNSKKLIGKAEEQRSVVVGRDADFTAFSFPSLYEIICEDKNQVPKTTPAPSNHFFKGLLTSSIPRYLGEKKK